MTSNQGHYIEDGVWSNVAMTSRNAGKPLVSICIPFFKFDATRLLRVLLAQGAKCPDSVELLLVDDASGEEALLDGLRALAGGSDVPVSISVFEKNAGRASARNYLCAKARGTYVLFLDCDMLPDTEEFVSRYLECGQRGDCDVVVGGGSYTQLENVPRSQRLYFYYSNRTQCLSAEARRREPMRYVFTNNAMIKLGLLRALMFDTEYVGWGYEDTDLAIGAGKLGATVCHVENTATHFGLVNDNELVKKYRESVQNFVHLVRKYPEEARLLPAFRAAGTLSRVPLPCNGIATACQFVVRIQSIPVRVRYVFLQAMKVFLYANALRLAL